MSVIQRTIAQDIPRVDGRASDTAAIAHAMSDHIAVVIAAAHAHYGRTALRLGDAVSRRWLTRTRNPYREEIERVAAVVGSPGAVLLNLSYEWACSAAVAPAPEGGMRLLRTLDWPLSGLGRTVTAIDRRGRAGDYLDFTWPGLVGVLTAIAPGRFAAAINQPPMQRRSSSVVLDWLSDRAAVWRQRALPPTHLLRRVFDTCRTYAEAKAVLTRTPIALPVFFTLAGPGEAEGCAIERTEDEAFVHQAPASITNHWLARRVAERLRAADSANRLTHMCRIMQTAPADLSWVIAPVRVPETRLAVDLTPATGRAVAQGFESGGPATALTTFRIPPKGLPTDSPLITGERGNLP